jgi:hypothetical protein
LSVVIGANPFETVCLSISTLLSEILSPVLLEK